MVVRRRGHKHDKREGEEEGKGKGGKGANTAVPVTEGGAEQWWKDVVVVGVLVALAAATRLWNIGHPRDIVFDETHFAKFATWYRAQQYFVDIHPPLAKLVHAAVLWAVGFEGAKEPNPEWWTSRGFVGTRDFEMLYEDEALTYAAVRTSTAMVGVGLVGCVYVAARAMRVGRAAAATAAWLVLCDNLVTLQSRLILTDAFLFLFVATTIGLSFASAQLAPSSPIPPTRHLVAFFATGASLGCALCVKLTALGVLGFVGIHQGVTAVTRLLQALRQGRRGAGPSAAAVVVDTVVRAGVMLGACAVVWCAVWVVHIHVLPYDGQGTAFMPREFQQTLSPKPTNGVLPPHHANRFGSMSLEDKLSTVIATTWNINQGGGALLEHPAKSRWYQWPLQTCRLVDFYDDHAAGRAWKGIGNPVGWWVVFGCVVAGVVGVVRAQLGGVHHPRHHTTMAFLLVGYLGNLVPFVLIERATWNYHYIPALEFGVLVVAVWMDRLLSFPDKAPLATKAVRVGVWVATLAVVAGSFAFFAPWTFGLPLTHEQHNARRWWAEW